MAFSLTRSKKTVTSDVDYTVLARSLAVSQSDPISISLKGSARTPVRLTFLLYRSSALPLVEGSVWPNIFPMFMVSLCLLSSQTLSVMSFSSHWFPQQLCVRPHETRSGIFKQIRQIIKTFGLYLKYSKDVLSRIWMLRDNRL